MHGVSDDRDAIHELNIKALNENWQKRVDALKKQRKHLRRQLRMAWELIGQMSEGIVK